MEVESTEQVNAATDRLKSAGLATFEENDTSCCYALQDKVWVHGPGQEPWEVYLVKADADTLGKSAAPDVTGDGCCTSQATEATAATGRSANSQGGIRRRRQQVGQRRTDRRLPPRAPHLGRLDRRRALPFPRERAPTDHP